GQVDVDVAFDPGHPQRRAHEGPQTDVAARIGDLALIDDRAEALDGAGVLARRQAEPDPGRAAFDETPLRVHVQRRTARAAVDLGLDRTDAEPGQGDPFTPAKDDGGRR